MKKRYIKYPKCHRVFFWRPNKAEVLDGLWGSLGGADSFRKVGVHRAARVAGWIEDRGNDHSPAPGERFDGDRDGDLAHQQERHGRRNLSGEGQDLPSRGRPLGMMLS